MNDFESFSIRSIDLFSIINQPVHKEPNQPSVLGHNAIRQNTRGMRLNTNSNPIIHVFHLLYFNTILLKRSDVEYENQRDGISFHYIPQFNKNCIVYET